MADNLTHTDSNGNAKMVDVGDKIIQKRIASATGKIYLSEKAMSLVRQNNIAKGDVITVAKIAGIQAAKKTSELIPLCHNLNLTKVDIQFELFDEYIEASGIAKCDGKTGVEMEALTAVNIALLTIYDMCKAVDKEMILSDIQLISKDKIDL